MFDQQAPYWNVRDVAAMRSQQQDAALVYVGPSVSADLAALVPWVAVLSRERQSERARAPRVRSAYESTYVSAPGGRIPDLATRVARDALQHGPVVFLVARAGYQPRLVCDTCRDAAVCSECSGPMVRTARSSLPMCVHCGRLDDAWKCGRCSGTTLRAAATGSERTAEELGRAFPGVSVRSSSGQSIVRHIPSTPSIVVATPGAVPYADGGYAAAVILDAAVVLSRPDLRAAEDAHARWCEVVSAVRPGGEVVVAADPDVPAVQALIRRDPVGFAERELASRREVALPPAVRLVLLTGKQSDVDDMVPLLDLTGVTTRGPVPLPDGQVRLLLTCPRKSSSALITSVMAASVVRATRKAGEPVNVRVDPRSV
jgi:primosomal protein N' (replication factor Y)